MIRQASWIHGNALTVESPQNLAYIGHHGWGTDLGFKPGKDSWCHIPIPMPVIMNDQRAKVQKLFLLFESQEGMGNITNIHIYDSAAHVQDFNNLSLQGNHRLGLDGVNIITLQNPHEVVFGMS